MMAKNIVKTPLAPAAVGVYSQGIELNGVYYFSGQIGLDPQTMELQEGFQAQLNQVLKNIDGLLESCSLNRTNIVKTTIFLTDLSCFDLVNKAYDDYFETPYPARSCVEVSALPKNSLIEIEVIAAR